MTNPLKRQVGLGWLIVCVIIVGIGGAWIGDIYQNRIPNPFLRSTKQLDLSSLNDLYSDLQRNYDGTVNAQTVLDGAREGLVASLGDPYTVYLTPAAAKGLNDDLSGSLSGIGAEIGVKNNELTVISPVAGTPAAKAGLQPDDVIAEIDGQTTSDLTLDTAVDDIRGKAGTKVTLQIIRGSQPAFNLTITRANITVPSVTWKMESSTIGYIDITTFGTDTSDLIVKAATQLKQQGATKIILDLRDDGGGYLDAGVAVATQFLPEGKTIVSERVGSTITQTYTSQGGGLLIGLPLVVLVNGGSASASEIVSGALHDNHVARLIGVQTFGKGSVQEIDNLTGGAELKVTVAHWYTPAGININKKGLTPDQIVQLTTANYNANQDPQLDAAITYLNSQP